MNFDWLTNLWPFTVAMLNIWSVYFGCKAALTVISFIIGFISSVSDNLKE